MLGFKMLKCGAKGGFMEVGARFYGFGPYSFVAGFIDEGVDNFFFRGETAISVVWVWVSMVDIS